LLLEALKSLIVPTPRFLRTMGYLSEVIAIESRYHRRKKDWHPHIEACHKAILRAVDRTLQKTPDGKGRKIVILGGALLYDIPLDRLTEAFEDVILVDLFHLPWIMRKLRCYDNVRFMMADLTGCLQDYHHVIHAARLGEHIAMPQKKPQLSLLEDQNEVDLILSVNLLSQLPAVPLSYAERKLGEKSIIPEDDFDAFADHLLNTHLEWLAGQKADICLISDLEKIHYDREGKALTREIMIEDRLLYQHGFQLDSEWFWDIAPLGEVSRKFSQSRKVVSVHKTI